MATKKTKRVVKPAAQADVDSLARLLKEVQGAIRETNKTMAGLEERLESLEIAYIPLKAFSDPSPLTLRRMIATNILAGQLAALHGCREANESEDNKAGWVASAYQWADELIRQS